MPQPAPPSRGRRGSDLGGAAGDYAGADRRAGLGRRTEQRARSLMSGKIIVGDCELSVDCVIRNLSAQGARVSAPPGIELPDAVGLLIVRDGLYWDAAVAWRKGDELGLTFRGVRHELESNTDPALRSVRALWAALVL